VEFSNDELRVAALTEMLAGVGEQVAEFAKREWSLKRDQRAAAKQAEKTFCLSSDTLEPQIQSELEELQAQFASQRDGIDQRQETERQALIERCDRIAAEIDHVRQHRIDVAKHHYQEATWVTNNGTQALKASEAADFDKLKAEVGEQQDALGAQQKRQTKLLKRFRKHIPEPVEDHEAPAAEEPAELLVLIQKEAVGAESALNKLAAGTLMDFFGKARAPVWTVLLLLVAGGAAFGLFKLGQLNTNTGGVVGGVSVLLLLLLFVFDFLTDRQVKQAAPPLVNGLRHAAWLCDYTLTTAEAAMDQRIAEHEAEMQQLVDTAKADSDARIARAETTAASRTAVVARERERLISELQARHDAERPGIDEAEANAVAQLQARSAASIDDLSADYAAKAEEQESQFNTDFGVLVDEWQQAVTDAKQRIVAVDDLSYSVAPDWQDESWEEWEPAGTAQPRIPFASLTVKTEDLFSDVPTDPQLPLELPEAFNLPALLMLPDHCNLLIEGREKAREIGIATLQNVMCRLLTQMPPGTVRFTLVDPVGLGQSFAGFMHLADYDDALVGGRIWTDERQIDSCLADLNDHMETVIQKYLRNEYESIADYNTAAGQIAEPYRFLVIADFPVNFSDTAVRRLMSIADSGARCGVYVLMFWDRRHTAPDKFSAGDMRKSGVHLHYLANRLAWKGQGAADFNLTLQAPPPDEMDAVPSAASRRRRQQQAGTR
jgi:hypothetical protein